MTNYRASFAVFLFCVIANYFIWLEVDDSGLGALNLIPFSLFAMLAGGICALIVFLEGSALIFRSNTERGNAGWKGYDGIIYVSTWILLAFSVYVVMIYGK